MMNWTLQISLECVYVCENVESGQGVTQHGENEPGSFLGHFKLLFFGMLSYPLP